MTSSQLARSLKQDLIRQLKQWLDITLNPNPSNKLLDGLLIPNVTTRNFDGWVFTPTFRSRLPNSCVPKFTPSQNLYQFPFHFSHSKAFYWDPLWDISRFLLRSKTPWFNNVGRSSTFTAGLSESRRTQSVAQSKPSLGATLLRGFWEPFAQGKFPFPKFPPLGLLKLFGPSGHSEDTWGLNTIPDRCKFRHEVFQLPLLPKLWGKPGLEHLGVWGTPLGGKNFTPF